MKNTLHRQLEDIFGFRSGMADELINQIVTCHRDQVSLSWCYTNYVHDTMIPGILHKNKPHFSMLSIDWSL